MRKYLYLSLLFFICFNCSSTKIESSGYKFKLSKQEQREGFKILFDGTSMSQWTSNTNEYVLEDGCIVMKPLNGHGNLYTKQEFENFILRFEFLLTPEANSGLGLRHKIITAQKGYDGMELQILDNTAPIYANLKPYQYHGSIYGWIPARKGFLKPVGEWNYQEVVANGNQIKVILNGTVIVDGNLKDAVKDTPENKIPKTLFYKKGHIAFLGHNSVVKFKNIRLKEIK